MVGNISIPDMFYLAYPNKKEIIDRLKSILQKYDRGFDSSILDLKGEELGYLYVLNLRGVRYYFRNKIQAFNQIRQVDRMFTIGQLDAQVVEIELNSFLYDLHK